MFFASLEFLLFFTALFFIFFFSPLKIRSAILLLASLLFIAFFSPSFLVYAILFSFVNFWIALMVNKEKNSKKRKNIFIGGQVFNIGGLVLFKYLSFIVENVLFILGIEASDLGLLEELPFHWVFLIIHSRGLVIYTSFIKPRISLRKTS